MRILFPLFFVSAVAANAAAQSADVRYVFFDWGKNEITRDASATLDAIASGYQPGMRWSVTGFTDRSGSAWSNLRTSKARAAMVRDYLVGKGVPAAALVVYGEGENRPVIATEDGVREVQNRRVEIRPIN